MTTGQWQWERRRRHGRLVVKEACALVSKLGMPRDVGDFGRVGEPTDSSVDESKRLGVKVPFSSMIVSALHYSALGWRIPHAGAQISQPVLVLHGNVFVEETLG